MDLYQRIVSNDIAFAVFVTSSRQCSTCNQRYLKGNFVILELRTILLCTRTVAGLCADKNCDIKFSDLMQRLSNQRNGSLPVVQPL